MSLSSSDKENSNISATTPSAKSINEAMSRLYVSKVGADVHFVPLLNSFINPPKKFSAHKTVLLSRSDVFRAQFVDWARSVDEEEKDAKNEDSNIELPDVEPEAFEQFLRFCYTDEADINTENAASILYIANRYDVQPLIQNVIQYLCEHITVENVFEMHDFAQRFAYTGIKAVEQSALEIIRQRTNELVKSNTFLGISLEKLALFAGQPHLSIKEDEVFQVLFLWAKRRQMDAENTGKSVRELLGPVLFHVQFWRITIRDFARLVEPTKVLTDSETLFILRMLAANNHFFDDDKACPFPRVENPRGEALIKCNLVDFVEKAKSTVTEEWKESIKISGFWFTLEACKLGNDCLNISLSCSNTDPAVKTEVEDEHNSQSWKCKASVRVSIESKKSQKQNKNKEDNNDNCDNNEDYQIINYVQVFSQEYDTAGEFFPTLTIEQMLAPANGWLDVDNNMATVKARVRVLDHDNSTGEFICLYSGEAD